MHETACAGRPVSKLRWSFVSLDIFSWELDHRGKHVSYARTLPAGTCFPTSTSIHQATVTPTSHVAVNRCDLLLQGPLNLSRIGNDSCRPSRKVVCFLTEHRVAKDLNPDPRRHRAYRPMLGCCLEDEAIRTNVVLRYGVRGAAIWNMAMTNTTIVGRWSSATSLTSIVQRMCCDNILEDEVGDLKAINSQGNKYYVLRLQRLSTQRKSTSNRNDNGYETEYVRRPPLLRDSYPSEHLRKHGQRPSQ